MAVVRFADKIRQVFASALGRCRALRRGGVPSLPPRGKGPVAEDRPVPAPLPAPPGEHAELLDRCLAFVKPDLNRRRVGQVRQALATVLDCGYLKDLEGLEADMGIAGRRLLEVGCGLCWYAPLLLARGAAGFVGVDQFKNFETTKIFDRRFAGLTETPERLRDMPLSLREFVGCFRGAETHSGDFLDFEPSQRFDAAYLLTVTEHLEDARAVFRRIFDLLEDDGLVYFSHHNYYCWNGHHLVPRAVAEYDPADPAMRAVADWNHLARRVGDDPSAGESLNAIRLHDLMALVQDLFVVERCHRERSAPERGGGRLTPELRARFPQFTEEELLVEMVYCTARKRRDRAGGAVAVRPERRGDRHRISIRLTWSNPETGHCFLTRVPAIGSLSDLLLFEDDCPLGPGDSIHADIRTAGGGRYSVWGNVLYFSASDNSDPRTNGRVYRLFDPADAPRVTAPTPEH